MPTKAKARSKSEITTISKQFNGHGRQTVTYREVLVVRGRKFQVYIKSDTYTFQSHAKVDLWTGSEWSEVHRIGGDAMKTSLAYSKAPTDHQVRLDREELIRVATEVVF